MEVKDGLLSFTDSLETYMNLYVLHFLNLGHLLDAMSNFCHQMAAFTKARAFIDALFHKNKQDFALLTMFTQIFVLVCTY